MTAADEHPPNATTGTCSQMCPDQEIDMRERCNLLHFFEVDPISTGRTVRCKTKRRRADRQRMVTKYSRPAAGSKDPEPKDIRPVDVLIKTVNYLINSIACRTDRSWHFVYDFVFDRLRAVRREMVIQCIGGTKGIQIYEVLTRFHIYAGYRLCMEPVSNFDAKINDTHTQECLKRLLLLYEKAEYRQTSGNMAEFMTVYLLYNLDSTEALVHGLARKHLPNLRKDDNFKLGLEISLAALKRNYVRVFRLSHKLAPLHAFAVSRHLPRIQSEALQIMSVGYSSKVLQFRLTDLSRVLGFDSEDEAGRACQERGLGITKDGVVFQRAIHKVDKINPQRYNFIDAAVEEESLPDLLQGRPVS